MRVDQDHPDFNRTLIILDNKWCRGALSADDEEGWVEVPDIAAMAPIDTEEELDLTADTEEAATRGAWEKLQTKRIYGEVQFKVIPAAKSNSS